MTKAKLPKTMLLSWGVPPAAIGSGIVIQNLARQFEPHEMVVVGAWYPFHPPSEWQPTWPHIVYGMIQPPFTWRGELWLRRLQWPLLLLVSLWVLLNHSCQVILCVFPDELFLLAGYLLSKLTRKPLFLYLHNTFADAKPNDPFFHWLQERVFSSARHAFVMSEGMQAFFHKKYPKLDCSPLPHIINAPIVLPSELIIPDLHQPLRLVFTGNINSSCSDAAGRLKEWIILNPDSTLNIYSGMDPSQFARLGFQGEQIRIKTVSYDILLSCIREGDILIHPHGFTGAMQPIEYQTIFPTKTLEYLVSQRPILAHLPGDCFLAQFYRKHDCALIVDDPAIEAFSDGVSRLRSDPELRLRLVKNALKAALLFQGPIISDHFRKVVIQKTSLIHKPFSNHDG